MGRTVAELLASISWRELCAWAEFDELEPFGERRADIRNAHWMMHYTNMNRDMKQRPEPFALTDFMLFGAPRTSAAHIDASHEDARISMDTVAFLIGEAHKSGQRVDLES